jgi:hypothetical protein
LKKSSLLLGILLVSSLFAYSFNPAYAVEAVYHDYTSLVTAGAETFGIECNADNFVYMTTFAGTSGGLLKIDKKQNLWQSKSGVIYWQNDFGSFIRQTPYEVVLSPDKHHNVMERNHSDFGKLKEYALSKAAKEFDSKSIQGNDKGYFAYDFSQIDSRTQFLIDNNLMHLRK